MRILVTGANGFLASYIIRNLISRGETVYGMMRENADIRNLEGLPLFHVYGNLTNRQDVEKATVCMDVIVHTAALTSQSATDKEYYEVNVMGSHCLLQAAIANKVKKIIYISSANTVGYGNEQKPGTEELDIAEEFKNTGYARSKWMAERLFKKSAEKGEIEVVILNPSFMIGYDATKGSSSQIFKLFLKSNPLIIPDGGRNFIYVDDVAKAVCNAIDKGRNGERYLLVNENLTYDQFFSRVEMLSKVNKKKIKVPHSILYLFGIGGSFANMIGFHLPLNKQNAKVLSLRNYYSPEKAINHLGLIQTKLDIAISEALKNYLA